MPPTVQTGNVAVEKRPQKPGERRLVSPKIHNNYYDSTYVFLQI